MSIGKSSKKKLPEGKSDEWLVTYSDVITLLMAFFVMMFSVSKVDPAEFEMIKTAMMEQVAKKPVAKPFNTLFDSMKEELSEGEAKNKVKIRRIPRGILLEFTSSVMFDPGSAILRPEMLPMLKKFATQIKNLPVKSYKVVIEGHTDPSPIKSPRFASNWELSALRATSTLRGLVDGGIDGKKVHVEAFADTRPKVPNFDLTGEPLPKNQGKNRRVVIRVER